MKWFSLLFEERPRISGFTIVAKSPKKDHLSKGLVGFEGSTSCLRFTPASMNAEKFCDCGAATHTLNTEQITGGLGRAEPGRSWEESKKGSFGQSMGMVGHQL